MGDGLYDTFRTVPFPALYEPLKTPVTTDVLEAGFLYAIACLAFCFFLTLPGVVLKKRFTAFLKILIGVFILGSIFLCNFGQEWEVAELHTRTQYKAGLRQEIDADIEVKIGLRSVNITLKTDPKVVNFTTHNETINYNERFSWDDEGWTQGRGGFGPFAGLVQREYRAAQFKGVPYPILWVAEYFVPDGEGIRWGRFYRQAGYFSHILLWLAFPLFLLSVALIMMVRSYGAIFFILTGLSMITANLIYACVRNPTDLLIPVGEGFLRFHWGWCFWLCLATGLLNFILGCVAFVLDFVYPDWLCEFLNVDITQDFEEFYLSQEELKNLGIVVDSSTNGDDPNAWGYKDPAALHRGYRKKTVHLEEALGTIRLANRSTRYRLMNGDRGTSSTTTTRDRAPMPTSDDFDMQQMQGKRPGNMYHKKSEGNKMKRNLSFEDDEDATHGLNMDPMNPDDPEGYDNVGFDAAKSHLSSRWTVEIPNNEDQDPDYHNPTYDVISALTAPATHESPISSSSHSALLSHDVTELSAVPSHDVTELSAVLSHDVTELSAVPSHDVTELSAVLTHDVTQLSAPAVNRNVGLRFSNIPNASHVTRRQSPADEGDSLEDDAVMQGKNVNSSDGNDNVLF